MLVNPTFNRIILSEVHPRKVISPRLFTFGGNAILCKLSQNANARLEIILTVLDNSIVVSRSHPKNASSGKHSILNKIEALFNFEQFLNAHFPIYRIASGKIICSRAVCSKTPVGFGSVLSSEPRRTRNCGANSSSMPNNQKMRYLQRSEFLLKVVDIRLSYNVEMHLFRYQQYFFRQ